MSSSTDASTTSSTSTPNNTWAGIWVTGLASLGVGLASCGFFYYQRRRGTIYEPRQANWSHRSPPPDYAKAWWRAALFDVDDTELLRCVGLDGYMFLRFLRLGFYLCSVGTIMALVLVPVYATSKGVQSASFHFNKLTLARVKPDSDWRLWVAVCAWYLFVGVTMDALYKEWVLYRRNYSVFLAKGDEDMPPEYRYAVRVEAVPLEARTNAKLYDFFDRLFPSKVLQASVFWDTPRLDALVEERKQTIEKIERIEATLAAKPNEPRPVVRVDQRSGSAGLLTSVTATVTGGALLERDAVEHYRLQCRRLNQAINYERERLLAEIQKWNERQENEEEDDDDDDDDVSLVDVFLSNENRVTATAHVTFTSLRSKQAAIQCELNGDPDTMVVVPAPDPDGVLWDNVGVTLLHQHLVKRQAAFLFTLGILFWAIPVAFVTSIAKLNGILEAAGLPTLDPTTAWYGFIAGLLPVVFLAGFMFFLYKVIEATARHFVRYKSMTEVVKYTLYWHQLFQFANLWFIVIGGSFFDQLNTLLDNPRELLDIMATAMPGMAAFFINMMQVNALAVLGLELSLIPIYGLRMVMRLVKNEALLTQRELDEAQKPPLIEWGRVLPPIVFIFLVILVYMPIVPVMELFGMVYFGLSYVVYKHQCLHVYAQEFEGGGQATWQQLFPFLIICLYMGELIFIGYMGIKQAPTQSLAGFGPLIATVLFHRHLRRTIIVPLRNLPLNIAANVDIEDGELEHGNKDSYQLYGMPVLKSGDQEEREPLPYRREQAVDTTEAAGQGDEPTAEFLEDERSSIMASSNDGALH